MFSLEVYKLFRSRTWLLVGLSILVPFLIAFGGDSDNDFRFIYNPLLQSESNSWLYFVRCYNFFFILFFPSFLIVLYASTIYMDKEARLLSCFTISHISKIKFWVAKYLFLQILTVAYITLYLCLPAFLYILFLDPTNIDIAFIQTGLFLSIKSWLSLLFTTTILFLVYLSVSRFYMGILLALGVYIWMLIFPGSPIVLFAKSVNAFSDLSQSQQPFIWNMENFKWEVISLKMTFTVIILFAVTTYFLRHTVRFQRLFFGFILIIMINISCSNENNKSGQPSYKPMAARDSSLIPWLDTVQITDKANKRLVLSDLLNAIPSVVIYLDFWNSHCIPCMKAFPQLNELSKEYTIENLKIIYVNTDEDLNRWHKALSFTENKHHPDHYRVKYPNFEVLSKVGLNVYPRYVVLDRNKKIITFRAPVPDHLYIDSLLMP